MGVRAASIDERRLANLKKLTSPCCVSIDYTLGEDFKLCRSTKITVPLLFAHHVCICDRPLSLGNRDCPRHAYERRQQTNDAKGRF